MSKIGFVTDSSSDLPLSYYSGHENIIMEPLYVRLGMEALMDWYDISPELSESERRYTIEAFYHEMRKKESVPYTIPVNVYRLQNAYEKLAKNCDVIISVHFSKYLGYTVEAARIAAKKVRGCKIIVIDTQQISNGYGAIIQEAVKKRDSGAGCDEIVDFIHSMIKSLNEKLIMRNDTTLYLYRCKRMSLLKYIFSNILQMKNFTLKDGRITPLFDARGKKGYAKLIQDAITEFKKEVKNGKTGYFIVSHADNEIGAKNIIDLLKKENINYEERFLGPITGVYGGPGTIAIMPIVI